MSRIVRFVVAATVVAAVLVLAPHAARVAGHADAASTVNRPSVIWVTRAGVYGTLAVDGRRLAWSAALDHPPLPGTDYRGCELVLQVFDRPTRTVKTLRPDLNCEVPEIIGPALAGWRVLFADASSGLSTDYATVETMAIGDRRRRVLKELS